MKPTRELELLRFLLLLRAQLATAQDDGATIRSAVRECVRVFSARSGQLCALDGRRRMQVLWHAGSVRDKPAAALARYLDGGEWPRPSPDLLLAPVARRGRRWGLLLLEAEAEFAPGEGRMLVAVGELLAERIRELDRRRASEVRARIDRKIMAQLRPQDLCYQILHGLRSLTDYDHSGALFTWDDAGSRLRLAAEQVAWSKGKSSRIGLEVALSAEQRAVLAAGATCGLDRVDGGFATWLGTARADLAHAVDLEPGAPPAGSILLAPLLVGKDLLGVIKLASVAPKALGAYEADLLQRFLPQAAVAIRNATKTESLKENVLRAERKHAMADLARGVAHDINNALGAISPLVQQLQAELRTGEIHRDHLAVDLQRIADAVATCRRIFAGMLAFAKGAAGRGARHGDLRRAVDNAAAILRATAARRGVRLELDIATDLPPIAGAQHELEQLFLNLMTNAYDAMPDGGALRVRVTQPSADDRMVVVQVIDTGHGMSHEELARIDEAFFTTKPTGSGLGLSICRSIVTDMGARMQMTSEVGVGTQVALQLPILGREDDLP